MRRVQLWTCRAYLPAIHMYSCNVRVPMPRCAMGTRDGHEFINRFVSAEMS